MVKFPDLSHRKVYYPDDRRHRIKINRQLVLGIVAFIAMLFAAAWVQRLALGMPHISINNALNQGQISGPHGFQDGYAGRTFSTSCSLPC